MDTTENLLQKIIQLQEREGYSDQQMAEKIGCSRPLYQRTRTEKIPVGGTFIKGAMALLASQTQKERKAEVIRNTRETDINLELNLDGTGNNTIATGVKMLDHFLEQTAKHGLFDIKITASGDDVHHITEDVAICLGKAFLEALGEKRGIARMADAMVPMDETLASVAVDISGRGYSVIKLEFSNENILDLPTEMIGHFLESFASEAKINLHVSIAYGKNDHHKAEAVFKALGRALDTATKIDERIAEKLPTTKEYLET